MFAGYLKLHRKLKDSSFYQDSETVHLWLHLLMIVKYEPQKTLFGGEEVELKPGQIVTGRKKISAETGISESKVQRALKSFERWHMIEQQTNSRSRLITIVSWDKYQVNEQQMNNKRTTDEQQMNNKRTLYKEEKKEKKERKEEVCLVVDYLNSKIGTKYKSKSKSTNQHITARLNEGFTVDDFYKVIDKKFESWDNDPKMKQYLRPQTLFGTKFESYLNEPVKNKPTESVYDFI